MALTQSTARDVTFLMVQSSDHITGITGATVTVTISKNGATFGAAAGTVSELANGWYKVALTTADTNTAGDLAFHCTATSADPTDFRLEVAASIADQVWDEDITGHTTTDTTGARIKALGDADDTAASGTGGSIVLGSGANTTDDYYKGLIVVLQSGTGAGQARIITDYVGSTKTASVTPDWVVTPDGTTQYYIKSSGPIDTSLIKDLIVESEGNFTLQQVLSTMLAGTGGEAELSGNTLTLKTPNGNATRIVSATDGAGQRTSITLTPSS